MNVRRTLTLTALLASTVMLAWACGQAREQAVGDASATAPSGAMHPSMAPGANLNGMVRGHTLDVIGSARAAAPAGSLPALDEEVWVIIEPEVDPGAAPDDAVPGTGALMCSLPDRDDDTPVPLPLEHTEVQTAISAYIASVQVTQRFHNPYDSKIEAVYVFPLPHNAAINGFIMTIGERRIRGIIREREEATRIYEAARSQGHVASLLTQERANVFTQRVANIEPGKRIDVDITYFHTLQYDDGWYEYVFPMVVGPRFNPPGTADGVGAVARGNHGGSGQSTEIQYLAPNERSGHDIGVTVDLDAGVEIEEIVSRSHRIEVMREGSAEVRVALAEDDRIPNKDFVLRYRVAGDEVKSGLLTHRDERGGFFTFMLYPPQQLDDLARRPMEMIFVIDCSGSMRGVPLAQAKDAVEHALGALGPQDSLQVIRFSNDASQLGPYPIDATADNVALARRHVRSLKGGGGTMMIEGIKAALDFDHDPERLRVVTFLTDGYIGNEGDILGAIQDRIGALRIFSFGVGSSPNRYLMNGMAKMGRGAVAYLGPRDDGEAVMDWFLERVSHPVLTDVSIDFGGTVVTDMQPSVVPDLFVGRPVILSGRFEGEVPATVRVRGRAGDRTVEASYPFDPAASDAGPALASVWARSAIAQLADRASYDPDPDVPGAITALALEYDLMSAYTAFVAVDAATRTAGTHGTSVQVAVPVPEGVMYETTVQE